MYIQHYQDSAVVARFFLQQGVKILLLLPPDQIGVRKKFDDLLMLHPKLTCPFFTVMYVSTLTLVCLIIMFYLWETKEGEVIKH